MNLTAGSAHGVIRFSLKESFKVLAENPKQESLIVMHFSSKGRRFKKSIGYKCPFNQWDMAKQRVKTTKGMLANAYQINETIDRARVFAQNQLSKMINEDNFIDIAELSRLVATYLDKNEDEDIKDDDGRLIPYALKLLQSKKGQTKVTTYTDCHQTIRLLELYEKKNRTVIRFDDIDMVFYRSFVSLMEKEDYRLNSIGKHIKNLKTFLNDALTNGVTNNAIFKNRNFKVLKERTTEVYLTNEEIKILAKEDFSEMPRIQQARDIFLIGCYTGQRVSDYNGISEKNIEIIDGHKFIKLSQKKTDTITHIPIIKEIREVMKRYDNRFPPKLSEPILRKNIKLACSLVGFNELINVTYTKGGKKVAEEIPKYKLVRTHTARRSFCTNFYIQGKPVQNIMLFTGHKTEKDFLTYIRIEKKQESLAVLRSGFFD
ncbi:site-specific integrase [Flagellimonas sp. HMM57]|uniref:phage integrase SAM-like domain-containing protein n=1 Tax=unclassified Flagellimonas TaxID=2644544 RepID=UPI0013D261C7|nr:MULTISPECIES: phage integrase SAM-like domain-containing protein [unclassified Flagellimonas]UII77175.1 site-specific integrase [Flagellimonas sp. HMM57]